MILSFKFLAHKHLISQSGYGISILKIAFFILMDGI